MDSILSEAGFAINATDYAKEYGNEALLKLQKKYTIRTVDRTTKIPQITKIFQLIKCNGFKIIEFPRFIMNDLYSETPTAKAPVNNIQIQLPIHPKIDTITYTGKSNPNQNIVVNHVVNNIFKNDVAGLTLNMQAGCHAADTEILMYDGRVKKVQDVEVGDHLMGDDSTPRKVLKLVRGYDDMYRITNQNKESYEVNGDHILCLKYTNKNSISHNMVVEISVLDYLKLPKSLQKDLKGYKSGVEYPDLDTPIDPYMIGFWLGDENANTSIITSQDQASSRYPYCINGNGGNKVGSNKFLNALNDLKLIHNKHIPYIYKCNSRQNRLRLLAGLIDSAGCLTRDNCTFEFVQSERLFDDVMYLARSLGFSCYKSKQTKSGFKLRMHITGQIKNILVSQIKVEKIDKANYYGFQVDSNQRYLMGSFTATHNCGKSFVAMDIIGRMKLKTLIVAPNTYLLDQWVGLLKIYFPTIQVGTLYGKEKQDGDVIVGIINTVSDLQSYEVIEKMPLPNVGKTLKYVKVPKVIDVNNILKTVGLTIFDESHMYVSKEFRKVFKRIHSRYTIGLSATPDIREDKLDIIHQSWLGPILVADSLTGYSVSQDAFVSDTKMIKYHALNQHCQFNIREDGMIEYTSIIQSIITDPHRNNLIIDEIIKLMNSGHYTFVFSDRRTHLEHLYELLEDRCIQQQSLVNLELPESNKKVILYGGADENTIDKAKKISNVVFTTYAYSSTGVSITKMNGLVLTTPRRSNMKQIINRVFRLGSDQGIKRIIVDIVDAKLPIKGQVRERLKAYEERGCKIIKESFDASTLIDK